MVSPDVDPLVVVSAALVLEVGTWPDVVDGSGTTTVVVDAAALVLDDDDTSPVGRPPCGSKQDTRVRAKARMRLIPAVCPLLFVRATL